MRGDVSQQAFMLTIRTPNDFVPAGRPHVDINISDPAFDASTFSKNKERLLQHEVARRFFAAVKEEARRRQLLSDDHFTVDGTLLEAWASLKSVRPRDEGNPQQRTG